ncbi:MAG: Export ABC transporter permease protein [Candidatus Falkowbacteria bacterium GW2011_GWC2_38_22]|uniref:Export ABC transporter permease protein n=1 Tax=Candidatus Falkowbacteria bacterium GW2011_GWE1_38_31 TaxID=1618638 RepID=A0A0G0JT26_9BACT|nr:MAG: Export ABC transporter permease protein [Candidatus Falkowbacteria bacterium GW2011_GWF2_38_1205]KKQ61635.1 MAG: Export ABC transporter permease protein [Candidatus Falkowbacteria bacterium GW2011_GWC2_38_22]KKQ63750.1 MAG: Export ABC transporter permease protein [Candidatus Falkowbacteria bacterium GW2011_GWF1_38_22]KKQ65834.1 MAG: Export ABC transporter permease protein [Candidatus Falkowbacteria bacterium GW2011_GWE2_38_254]KKQ70613.1 MAG: Export ABC transporter permease protein [Can
MFTHLTQTIKTAVKALLTNKMRSFLTMLGIIIGVGAVIVIMAVGAGAQSLILNQVSALGTNIVGVLPGNSGNDGPPTSVMGIVITTLTYDDALALAQKINVPDIMDVVAYSTTAATLEWGTNSFIGTLSGCTTGYMAVEGGELAEGRFFTKDEERNLSKVIVLGSDVKNDLFGDSEAVGQRIKIKTHSFEVIGVMKERGTVAFQNYDNKILVPIKTVQKLIAGVDHISLLRAKINSSENVKKAIDDMKATLRERHDISDSSGASDDFTVSSAAQALDMITTITNALKYFLAAMAAMSLIVGGIGIMNIMLVSVSERTREIGLRKAIGAKNSNILNQFLLEAITITVLGGVFGIIGGVFVSFLVALIANYLEYDWSFVISPLSIVLAVGVSAIVGLVFGVYPASKASKLQPVEALRYE